MRNDLVRPAKGVHRTIQSDGAAAAVRRDVWIQQCGFDHPFKRVHLALRTDTGAYPAIGMQEMYASPRRSSENVMASQGFLINVYKHRRQS